MHSADPPLDIGQCNCFAVRKAARRISRLYDDLLQATGLRITQFLILAVLAKVRSASVNELSERLDLERTATGKALGPLERARLVRVDPSATDGRSHIVTLTPLGDRTFQDAIPLWREAQQRLAELNGKQHMAALRADLSEIEVGRISGDSAG